MKQKYEIAFNALIKELNDMIKYNEESMKRFFLIRGLSRRCIIRLRTLLLKQQLISSRIPSKNSLKTNNKLNNNMKIKFLSEQAFKTGYTLLHGHNFVFDTYKSECTMKFFYLEMLEKAKSMLTSRNLQEGSDYTIEESERLCALV